MIDGSLSAASTQYAPGEHVGLINPVYLSGLGNDCEPVPRKTAQGCPSCHPCSSQSQWGSSQSPARGPRLLAFRSLSPWHSKSSQLISSVSRAGSLGFPAGLWDTLKSGPSDPSTHRYAGTYLISLLFISQPSPNRLMAGCALCMGPPTLNRAPQRVGVRRTVRQTGKFLFFPPDSLLLPFFPILEHGTSTHPVAELGDPLATLPQHTPLPTLVMNLKHRCFINTSCILHSPSIRMGPAAHLLPACPLPFCLTLRGSILKCQHDHAPFKNK